MGVGVAFHWDYGVFDISPQCPPNGASEKRVSEGNWVQTSLSSGHNLGWVLRGRFGALDWGSLLSYVNFRKSQCHMSFCPFCVLIVNICNPNFTVSHVLCRLLIWRNPNVTCLCHLFLALLRVNSKESKCHMTVAFFLPMTHVNFKKSQRLMSLSLILSHVLCRLSILTNPMSHVSVTYFYPCRLSIFRNPNVTCLCCLFLPISSVTFQLEEIPMSHVSVTCFWPCPVLILRNPNVTWPLLIFAHDAC